jgi:light-regulated signal transduction histidine kinase (bacteriophytochrome)
VHSIDLYVGNASSDINKLIASNISNEIKSKLYSIKSNIDKAIKVSQIIIKSNFDYKYTNQRINLPKYIEEYLNDLSISFKDIRIDCFNAVNKFVVLNPIEFDIIMDNLVSNSRKANANKILVEFEINENKLEVYYYDDGDGMPENLVNNSKSIFELGVRESKAKGSGIGMYDIKKRVDNLKGTINFLGNNLKLKGASFKIVI